MDGQSISAECGIFVKLGAAGDGSQASPFGTLTDAAAQNNEKPIYVCGGDVFTGSIAVPAAVSIYGAFDCATWTFRLSNPRAVIESDPNVPAVTVETVGAHQLANIDIRSVAATAPGASSIGVLITSSLDLSNAKITAGAGANGSDGADQLATPSPTSANGLNGTDGCVGGTSTIPQTPPSYRCSPTGKVSGGGFGGVNLGGTNGGTGFPGDSAASTSIDNGGQGATRDPDQPCHPGGPGVYGDNGDPGLGSSSSDKGKLDFTGYVGPSGGLGTSGTPAQGGGGGGSGASCSATILDSGPTGGNGGAGGCGGMSGIPGGGGGGSFGVLSAGAVVSLTQVMILTSSGGNGGRGGKGQPGSPGGMPGLAGLPAAPGSPAGACDGGEGGQGGQGGAAGGGGGGPSVGIAYLGSAPTENGGVAISVGSPSSGGKGAIVPNIAGDGAAGFVAMRQSW